MKYIVLMSYITCGYMLELSHLRYFYEVARHGSFSKASRSLRVSQPAVSKAIRQLEYREDLKLLERNTRGVQLTESGRVLFTSCEQVFQTLSETEKALHFKDCTLRGSLSIGASDNICNYLLPPVLNEFLSSHPKVVGRVFNGTSENIKQEILTSKSELGIFHSPVKDRNFSCETLGFVEFWIVVKPSEQRRFESLETAPFIGPRAQDYANPFPICNMLGAIGIVPKVAFESNSQETQKRMALLGFGFAVLPHYLVRNELKLGKLVRIRTSKRLGSHVHLVWKRNRELSAPAALFKSKLLEPSFLKSVPL